PGGAADRRRTAADGPGPGRGGRQAGTGARLVGLDEGVRRRWPDQDRGREEGAALRDRRAARRLERRAPRLRCDRLLAQGPGWLRRLAAGATDRAGGRGGAARRDRPVQAVRGDADRGLAEAGREGSRVEGQAVERAGLRRRGDL